MGLEEAKNVSFSLLFVAILHQIPLKCRIAGSKIFMTWLILEFNLCHWVRQQRRYLHKMMSLIECLLQSMFHVGTNYLMKDLILDSEERKNHLPMVCIYMY